MCATDLDQDLDIPEDQPRPGQAAGPPPGVAGGRADRRDRDPAGAGAGAGAR